MAQITKTYDGQVRTLTLSSDGSVINASIEWVDSSADARLPARPAKLTLVRIAGGKVIVDNKEIETAPADLITGAKALAPKMKSFIDTLISSGKVSI